MPAFDQRSSDHRKSSSKLDWVDTSNRHSSYEATLAALLAKNQQPPQKPSFKGPGLENETSTQRSSWHSARISKSGTVEARDEYDKARKEIFGQRAGRVQGSIRDSLIRQEVSALFRSETTSLDLKSKRREWHHAGKRSGNQANKPKSLTESYFDSLGSRASREDLSRTQKERVSGSMAWNISTAPLNSEEVDLEELEPSANPIHGNLPSTHSSSDPVTREERISLARSLIGVGRVEDGEAILRSINARSQTRDQSLVQTVGPRSALAELFTDLYTGTDVLGGDLDKERTTARMSTREEIALSWDKRFSKYNEQGPVVSSNADDRTLNVEEVFKPFNTPKRGSASRPKSTVAVRGNPMSKTLYSAPKAATDDPSAQLTDADEAGESSLPDTAQRDSEAQQSDSLPEPKPLNSWSPSMVSKTKTPRTPGSRASVEDLDFTPRNIVKEIIGRDLMFLEKSD